MTLEKMALFIRNELINNELLDTTQKYKNPEKLIILKSLYEITYVGLEAISSARSWHTNGPVIAGFKIAKLQNKLSQLTNYCLKHHIIDTPPTLECSWYHSGRPNVPIEDFRDEDLPEDRIEEIKYSNQNGYNIEYTLPLIYEHIDMEYYMCEMLTSWLKQAFIDGAASKAGKLNLHMLARCLINTQSQ